MPIAPAFSINAIQPISPSTINLVDLSTGSDAAISSRQILLYQIDNTLLTSPITWPYSASSISIAPLTQDIAVNVVVNWLAVDGVTVLYTSSQIFGFKNYSEQFYYSLIQAQTAQPNVIIDVNYITNLMQLRVYLDSVFQAISVGQDIYAAESIIQKAIYMVQQHQLFFNV